jgi:Na+-driven multidrug efflux pump
MRIPMYANMGATIVHLIIAYTLVNVYDTGMWGIAIASSFQFFVRYVITKGHTVFSDRFKESRQPLFDKETLNNLGN